MVPERRRAGAGRGRVESLGLWEDKSRVLARCYARINGNRHEILIIQQPNEAEVEVQLDGEVLLEIDQ